LPALSKTSLFRIVQLLNRFVPIVARGLAVAFAILAVGTAAFGMGDYASAADRHLVALLFAFLGVASFAIGRATKPILKWILRRVM
jgi:hypothetical protein